jgi:hypothetical protein
MTANLDTRAGRPWIFRRWPAIAAIIFAAALSAALWVGFSDTAQMSQVLTAAGFVYLGSAALGSRRAAWPLFGLTFVVIGIGYAVPGLDPTWVLLGGGAVLAVVGLVRGALRPGWGLPLQLLAMTVIAAVAVAVMFIGQPAAGLLVGVGLLAHATWDVVHFRSRRVVMPSMAEFCAVLDTLLGLVVIAAAFLR